MATQTESDSSSSSSSSVLILHNALIVTMDPQSRVFRDGAIVIQRDTIKAMGHSHQILTQFSYLSPQLIDLQGQFLLPGFINTHVHTSQQLGRGIADDVDLLTWLHRRIWPYESNMTEDDSYISTLLCGIELIHSGVCMHFSPLFTADLNWMNNKVVIFIFFGWGGIR